MLRCTLVVYMAAPPIIQRVPSYRRVVSVSISFSTASTDMCVLFYSDVHVIANWFQNRRGRDVANKNAAIRPDTIAGAANKGGAFTSNGAIIRRKCTPTTTSATVAKRQPVARPAASRPILPQSLMQTHFSVPMYQRNVPHSSTANDGRSVPALDPQFVHPVPAHQADPTMQVSFLDDFSVDPIQQLRWGMQMELNSSDPNLPNLLGTGMLHGAKKGIKPIAPEAIVFPSIPLRLPPLRVLGPVPSPGFPSHRPTPTSNTLPHDERPDPKSLPPVPQPVTPMPPPSVPEVPVERPSPPIAPKDLPLLVSKTTGAEIPPHLTRVPNIRTRRPLSRAMSLEYYAGMMEKNRSPKTAAVAAASLKEVQRTPVKSKQGAPLWASMVSSPPSPTSPVIRQADIERLKPLVKSGRTKSLEFACALARVWPSDLKNECGFPGTAGAKRKRLEDLLLEPRGRKVKKIRRTFSSGVKETQKEIRGLRKVASIAAIPLSQSEAKKKDIERPIGPTETHQPDIPLSGSSFISNATTLTISDDEPSSSTQHANPQSSVELKVTDWGLNAGEKENMKPGVTVKDLERNAVQVLASMMGSRV